MFPEFSPQFQEKQVSENTTLGKSFIFDFSAGDFVLKDGKLQVAEGVEALKVWIQKILKTEKFKFKIYQTGEAKEYGVTLLELVNSGYPQFFIQAEIQREVTEALPRNPEILNVENFNFARDKRILTVSFTVISIYGKLEQVVSI